MGEVWRATDTRLQREVALKLLPAEFVADTERLARFEREAQLLAQLNHPNIAQIYGIEASGGVHALVMELVEGPTLAERLEDGALPVDESLTIALQIAEALEEAHERGIVHRDLKPQNIKAPVEGKVKVLDFGLAKAMELPGSMPAMTPYDLAHSPTVTFGGTREGVILGTASYMAPEQARGRSVDKRADIWAFGVVLYEMLSGERLFAEGSVVDTLSAVMRKEIDLGKLPSGTGRRLRELVGRCLERDPRKRLRDIGDARILIEEVLAGEGTEAAATATAAAGGWGASRVALAVAVALLLGVIADRWLVAGPSPAPTGAPLRLSVTYPEELEVGFATISPDGSAVLLRARRRDDPESVPALYRRELGAEEAVLLRGTERLRQFVLTPDGKSVVFLAATPTDPSDRRLMRMPIDGSQPPIEIARWKSSWYMFNVLPDGAIAVLTVDKDHLLRLPKGAGAAVDEPAPIDIGRPAGFGLPGDPPLPDGRIFLRGNAHSERGWEGFTALVDPTTGKGSIVLPDGRNPRFVPPGRLLYTQGSTLLGVRFDSRSGRTEGQPVALAQGLQIGAPWADGRFGLANDGTLAYHRGGLVGAGRRFVVLDPASGEVEPWNTERRYLDWARPEPSRDGRWVYMQVSNAAGAFDIWRLPRTGPAEPVVALGGAEAASGRISPDGSTVAFLQSSNQPSDGIYLAPTDRLAPPREILRTGDVSAEGVAELEGWTPDGHRLVVRYDKMEESSLREIAVDSASGMRVLVPAPSADGAVSPDGRHLAFASTISGRWEVYVADYDPTGPIGERFAVSRHGGGRPAWSPDGRTLYFSSGGSEILAAAIGSDGRPAGAPGVVADLEELRAAQQFAVLPEGRLILIQRGPEEREVDRIDLILHFDRILQERLP